MENYKYVIIGGGTTAGYAATEFVEQGIARGELCIISNESILPMNRPPFSKQYLRDMNKDEEILVNDKAFYQSNGIDVMLNTSVKSVDFDNRQIELDKGESLKYEKLLIATGSKLKYLNVPGGDLKNIFYLRNIKHADKIRKQAKKSKSAVVVGGGYIGSETAASLSEMGPEVTMIIPESHLLAKFTNEEIANYFEDIYSSHGIRLMFNDEAVAFHGNASVEAVGLKSVKKIATDMVVVGIGVEPNTQLFEGSALEMGENGIRVNEYCETNIENVYAAGDVVEFPGQIFDKPRHVEHWENAFEQGKHAAGEMTGKHQPYVFVPYFFSDIFDLSYEYFGDQESADFSVTRGEIKSGDFSHWWFKGDRLVAAFIMSSRPDEEREIAGEWIKEKKKINRDKLHDTGVKMEDLVLKT